MNLVLKYHLNIKYNFLIKSLSVVQIVLEDQELQQWEP